MNLQQNKDRGSLIAEQLVEQGWTDEELIDASRVISTDPEIAKEATFAGALTPHLFTLAREKMNAKQVLGKCFHSRDEYNRCKNDATIADWGDIYCETCHARHLAEIPSHRLNREMVTV